MSNSFANEKNLPMEDDQAVTNVEKMRGLRWAVFFNSTNQIFVYLTFFGPMIVLFFNRLGFSKSEIGNTLGILYITGVFSILLVPFAARIGYKNIFLRFMSARALVVIFMLFAPFVLTRFGDQVVVWYVMAIVGLFAFFRTVSMVGWMPWSQEYVPGAMRGKYTAINSIFTNAFGFLTVVVAGWVVGDGEDMNRFLYLFAASLVFASLTVWGATRVPGGTPRPKAGKSHVRQAFATLKDSGFLLFMLGSGLITLGYEPMNAFLPLYNSEQLGLGAGVAIYIQSASMLGGIISSYVWGWGADRYGSKPVMLSGLGMYMVVPVLWFVIPRGSDLSMWFALAVSLVSGIASMGWLIGSSRMLYVNLVPAAKSGDYMAVWTTWGGITWALSQVLGGSLLDASAGVSGQIWIFEVDAYSVLFGLAIAVPLFTIFLLRRVREKEDEVSVGEFTSLFLHGNPFLAVNAMIGFQRARDEQTTVMMTERLGQSRSPLTVEELLEALSDPRFNVRFEAIISIARREPDSRLTASLCKVLERDEPALGVVAAWALGRLGDPDALGSLRDGLDAPYRSIQAHSARSLGTLQDSDILPVLTRRLAEEKDLGLKVAFSSALGKLRAEEAVPDMLALLREHEDRFLQLEIALALARIINEEPRFIEMLRGIRNDPGTTLSRSTSRLLLKYQPELTVEQAEAISNSSDAFAHDDLESGVLQLVDTLDEVDLIGADTTIALIANECIQRLKVFGPVRQDYLILFFLCYLHNTELEITK